MLFFFTMCPLVVLHPTCRKGGPRGSSLIGRRSGARGATPLLVCGSSLFGNRVRKSKNVRFQKCRIWLHLFGTIVNACNNGGNLVMSRDSLGKGGVFCSVVHRADLSNNKITCLISKPLRNSSSRFFHLCVYLVGTFIILAYLHLNSPSFFSK